MGRITVGFKNFEQFQRDLSAIGEAGKKAVANTINDTKRRAPGWVADAAVKSYGIRKGEMMPANKNAKKPRKKAGSAYIVGDTVANLTLEYRGRVLTPTHFGMKPTKRPKRRYDVTAMIKRPGVKALGHSVFLGGNRGGGQIPFKRTGQSRLPIEPVKTVSVPQMIGNPEVEVEIKEKINNGMSERLRHHLGRALGIGKK